MLDVHLPTTDGREIVLTRYTHPETDLLLLLQQLALTLPEQAPPKSTLPTPQILLTCSADLLIPILQNSTSDPFRPLQSAKTG